MKILSAEQIKLADQFTVKQQKINSIDLMERAANSFVISFLKDFENCSSVLIFCGKGNNGGDGLAIARLLQKKNIETSVAIINYSKDQSPDFTENLIRLRGTDVSILEINSENDFPEDIVANTIIIDAVFGVGLSRSLDGIVQYVVNKLNKTSFIRVSVDMPTGLAADTIVSGDVFLADLVYTFHSPKLAMLLPHSADYVKEFRICNIRLEEPFFNDDQNSKFIISPEIIQNIFKSRNRFDHKGTNGHSLIVAGQKGMMGAALLASKACIKAGSGLVTAHIPGDASNIFQTGLWEVMIDPDSNQNIITECHIDEKYDSIGIGPGLGKDPATAQALSLYLKTNIKCVVDADALNIISLNRELLSDLENKIITPHPKEFERLFGESVNDFQRIVLLQKMAMKWKCVIVLKGAYTCIANADGKLYFNITGNNGLATAGSGDVLTGIITGLLAQKYQILEAAILGVYLHGRSADHITKVTSKHAMTASDIFTGLQKAFLELEN